MKKTWLFLKINWWGIASLMIGLVCLLGIHRIRMIGRMTGVWFALSSLALACNWWRRRHYWTLILAIIDLISAVFLFSQGIEAVIPMVYFILAILILNATHLFNEYYLSSGNVISVRILLWLLIGATLSLILYPWFSAAIWLIVFAGYFIMTGVVSLLANILIH